MPDIPILLREKYGLDRVQVPVSVNIPFPLGSQMGRPSFELTQTNGLTANSCLTPIARWHDQSIRWARLDFLADCGANSDDNYQLRETPSSEPKKPGGCKLTQQSDCIKIDTGKVSVTLSAHETAFLTLSKPEGGTRRFSLNLQDQNKQNAEVRLNSIALADESSPLVTLVDFSGQTQVGVQAINVSGRISAFYQQETIECDLRVHNPSPARHQDGLWDLGDEGSIGFHAFELIAETEALDNITWQMSPLAGTATASQTGGSLRIHQESSAGDHWNSPTHLDAAANIAARYPGYLLKSAEGHTKIAERASPVLSVRDKLGGLSVHLDKFWQNFPSALEIREKQCVVSLFPAEADRVHELQGGESKTHRVLLTLNDNPAE